MPFKFSPATENDHTLPHIQDRYPYRVVDSRQHAQRVNLLQNPVPVALTTGEEFFFFALTTPSDTGGYSMMSSGHKRLTMPPGQIPLFVERASNFHQFIDHPSHERPTLRMHAETEMVAVPGMPQEGSWVTSLPTQTSKDSSWFPLSHPSDLALWYPNRGSIVQTTHLLHRQLHFGSCGQMARGIPCTGAESCSPRQGLRLPDRTV